MIAESILAQMRELKLEGMVAEYSSQRDNISEYAHLSFDERLGLLINAEWNRKKTNRINKYIHDASFAIPSATIDGIEYHPDRKLDRSQIMDFATCAFIRAGNHIIIEGAAGNGKTYIACALGNAACRRDMSVRYIRLPELLDELAIARSEDRFKKVVKSYQRVKLLILDEWLLRILTPTEAYNLLEIIEARCENGSMIFCTHYSVVGQKSC